MLMRLIVGNNIPSKSVFNYIIHNKYYSSLLLFELYIIIIIIIFLEYCFITKLLLLIDLSFGDFGTNK